MNIEEAVQENILFKRKSYFGTYQRLFLFCTELFCLISVITIYSPAFYRKLNSKLDVYVLCRVTINIILAASRCIIVLVLIKSKKISSYLGNLHAIGIHQDHELKRFITQQQLYKNIAIATFTIIQYVLHGFNFINIDMNSVWRKSIRVILLYTYQAIYLLILREVVDVCIHLQAAFKLVNSKVSSLVNNQSINLKSLICCRRYYTHAVKATKSVENYFRCFVTFYFIQYAFHNIMNIVNAFGGRSSMDIYWMFHTINDTLLMIYLTVNLVSINLLSRESLDNLYELSFKMKRMDMKYENEIFIGRKITDVGFTFANLFTINTQFIVSMFTLSLTIILALAKDEDQKNRENCLRNRFFFKSASKM
uniref:Gustatory receptor n=1 Tax=Tetranychus urticae TaxID=32264 RepID=T1KUH1_TETUR